MSNFGGLPPLGPPTGANYGSDETMESRVRETRLRLRASGSNLAALAGLCIVIAMAGGILWGIFSRIF